MSFDEYQQGDDFPELGFDFPSAGDFQLPSSLPLLSAPTQVPDGKEEPSKKRKRPETPDEDVEVLDSGFITRAPLPIDQAEKLEAAAGVDEGTYFVELMRKRLRCIRDLQGKWVTRTCNKKKPKYVETQTRLRDFADVVLNSFEAQFGPASAAMTSAPTRKHAKTHL